MVCLIFFLSSGHEDRVLGTAVITNRLSVSTPERLFSEGDTLK